MPLFGSESLRIENYECLLIVLLKIDLIRVTVFGRALESLTFQLKQEQGRERTLHNLNWNLQVNVVKKVVVFE